MDFKSSISNAFGFVLPDKVENSFENLVGGGGIVDLALGGQSYICVCFVQDTQIGVAGCIVRSGQETYEVDVSTLV